jgi:hypothetical protein
MIALNEVGKSEQNNQNDGPDIEKYLKAVNLQLKSAYCYAGQYYSFAKACEKLKLSKDSIPIPKSGLANSVFNYASKISKKYKYAAEENDLIIWRKSNGINGHIERIMEVSDKGWVRTIAFNTSNYNEKQKKIIQGVFIKKRNIFHPLGRMQIRGLVGFIIN